MGRGHEHLDIAPDHLTSSVTKQLFGGVAEGLDDPTLIDRDDRVGGGIENGARGSASRSLSIACARLVSVMSAVELQDRYRIATLTPVQCPLACDHHSTAITMRVDKFTPPYSRIQQLSLNFRQWYRKLGREEFMEIRPIASPPATHKALQGLDPRAGFHHRVSVPSLAARSKACTSSSSCSGFAWNCAWCVLRSVMSMATPLNRTT